jgi:hypothetical protein
MIYVIGAPYCVILVNEYSMWPGEDTLSPRTYEAALTVEYHYWMLATVKDVDSVP